MRELSQSEAGDTPEAEAIRLAREGNAAAFESLYRFDSRRIFTLCLRVLENSAEAEDLTQETFLTVFRRIQTFRGESGFSTWLHRVTVNVVLMHIRKKTVAQTSLDEITDRTEETRVPPPVRGNKVVPFKRKRDLPIGDLTSGIDNPLVHASAAVK